MLLVEITPIVLLYHCKQNTQVILATPPVLKPAVFRAPKAGAVWGESLNSLNKIYL